MRYKAFRDKPSRTLNGAMIEARFGGVPRVDLSAAGDLKGYAARYDSPSLPIVHWDGRDFIERLAPGVFDESLKSSIDVLAFWQHDSDGLPLGRRSAGTLKLLSDSLGLGFRLSLPDTTLGRDVRTLMKRGDLDGSMSFAMIVEDDRWTAPAKRGGVWSRTVNRATLLEVSPVVTGAYPAAQGTLLDEDEGRSARCRRRMLRQRETST